ncbi:MAG: nucleotide pyrophosphohydrolase [Candidatus Altiarchaeales archaeon]|nr:nucleotide pyrophosphohydrolase [Candidatus Altiarchaeales archaeon]MBD3416061.1 nucleotide pyrophosphohydrolase [Candidatus Altiarchaeales archaeon]
MASFKELVELMAYMRGPSGCPWDREQTISDFTVHLRNESEEALQAIEKEDYENLREELGDLLLHVLFISRIAEEEGLFTIQDVMDGLKDKIVRRHPHVFGDEKVASSEDVMRQWKRIKEEEKRSG